MNVKPKKQFGQHFLINQQVVEQITEAIISFQLPVLEVGPGKGVLTQQLNHLAQFKCIEIDREAQEYLVQKQIVTPNQLIAQDFLKLSLPEVFENKPYLIAGNFPYNISTQIVFKILENRQNIPVMVGMFQKEVADRICSSNHTKQFGILSVLVQAYYHTSTLVHVDAQSFFPPPKVQSSVIILQQKAIEIEVSYTHLLKVVKMAFNQRRKTLRNSLKPLLNGINSSYLSLRPEQLNVNDFINLTQELKPNL